MESHPKLKVGTKNPVVNKRSDKKSRPVSPATAGPLPTVKTAAANAVTPSIATSSVAPYTIFKMQINKSPRKYIIPDEGEEVEEEQPQKQQGHIIPEEVFPPLHPQRVQTQKQLMPKPHLLEPQYSQQQQNFTKPGSPREGEGHFDARTKPRGRKLTNLSGEHLKNEKYRASTNRARITGLMHKSSELHSMTGVSMLQVVINDRGRVSIYADPALFRPLLSDPDFLGKINSCIPNNQTLEGVYNGAFPSGETSYQLPNDLVPKETVSYNVMKPTESQVSLAQQKGRNRSFEDYYVHYDLSVSSNGHSKRKSREDTPPDVPPPSKVAKLSDVKSDTVEIEEEEQEEDNGEHTVVDIESEPSSPPAKFIGPAEIQNHLNTHGYWPQLWSNWAPLVPQPFTIPQQTSPHPHPPPSPLTNVPVSIPKTTEKVGIFGV